jgi:3-ketoacyl-CoA synthase
MHCDRATHDIPAAMREAEMVMGGAITDLLEKTGLKPQDVDILVTNCSIFCPTPSLASLLVNKFKFRHDCQTYSLGGMGCGNGVMAVGLIRDLLKARPNSTALFVSAEITTYCYYPGLQRDYMVANAIFRMGGAAAMFTNKPSLKKRAKYSLEHQVRVHTGQDDGAYNCMGWGPDKDGVNGVYLRKDVPAQAARALEMCLRTVAPRLLTWTQLAEALANVFERKVMGKTNLPEYVPDWTRCVDRFALHAGGYAVLKGLQAAMNLPVERMMPSFATLRDFGNTSCSTTWYVLGFLETAEGIKRGQTVMQIGMGGGMKAGVNVWRAQKDVKETHPAWRHIAALGRALRESDLPRPITCPEAPAASAACGEAAQKATAQSMADRLVAARMAAA